MAPSNCFDWLRELSPIEKKELPAGQKKRQDMLLSYPIVTSQPALVKTHTHPARRNGQYMRRVLLPQRRALV
eukprot:10756406-Prorocentrum_lima.AAC.1